MLHAWIAMLVLCNHEVRGFLIHNTQHSLCLEDRSGPGAGAGAVGLGACNLDSQLQQWVWWNRRTLKNLGSDRCLAGRGADRVRTVGCQEEEEGAGGGQGGAAAAAAAAKEEEEEEVLWDCEGGRLISVSSSLELSLDDSLSPTLALKSKRSGKWRSLDEGDICQESLRSKRASKGAEEFETPGEGQELTEEQRRFLVWYYRTEDSTTWRLVMLGLSFVCLLVGFLLLGMGSMANKSRRKIAAYKAAAASAHREELLSLTKLQGQPDLEAGSQGLSPPDLEAGSQGLSPPDLEAGSQGLSPPDLEAGSQGLSPPDLEAGSQGLSPPAWCEGGDCASPGDILVTWRDGNVSSLYPDPPPEEQEEEQEEEEKEEHIELSPDIKESRREESVEKEEEEEERGVCNDEGVQQMNGPL
ncbi:Organic solute transporter subunit beta [Merluccius polli]|uniref:Organic solute transporter subunit beta n=1 Tax=Merluccius polli TaxID=89951 RepID=A0AA47MBJ2_MERPO|nr:Organic solute transporter subunit beta [Merluccius polli]